MGAGDDREANQLMRYPAHVHIRDVSPRDGLQGERELVSLDDKVRLIDMLSAAGFPQINATSFVSPRAVPQMADAAEVMARIARRPGVTYDVSVPNLSSARRAFDTPVDALMVFVDASDISSLRSVRRSTDDSMREAEGVIAEAPARGLPSMGTVATAFGSPYEGTVPAERVLGLARRFVDAGVNGLALGDTTGEADPAQVQTLVARLLDRFPDVPLSLHFHDTRGLALANVLAAMDAGATRFDAAVGGIGGNPFLNNAAGNVATEDLVHMCDEMGIQTGIDLDAVLDVYRFLELTLKHPLVGNVGRAGRSKSASPAVTLHAG
jgi:hydroxymethylglutaryl-CoA lyase